MLCKLAIPEHAQQAAFAESLKAALCGHAAEREDLDAAPGALLIEHPIHPRIAMRQGDCGHGESHTAQEDRTHLPVAKVGGQDDDAASIAARRMKVRGAVHPDGWLPNPVDGKKLHEVPPETPEHLAHDRRLSRNGPIEEHGDVGLDGGAILA
jgi:hypothetical protein